MLTPKRGFIFLINRGKYYLGHPFNLTLEDISMSIQKCIQLSIEPTYTRFSDICFCDDFLYVCNIWELWAELFHKYLTILIFKVTNDNLQFNISAYNAFCNPHHFIFLVRKYISMVHFGMDCQHWSFTLVWSMNFRVDLILTLKCTWIQLCKVDLSH